MAYSRKNHSYRIIASTIYVTLILSLCGGAALASPASVQTEDSAPPMTQIVGRVNNAPEGARVRALHTDGAHAGESYLGFKGQFVFPPMPVDSYTLQVLDSTGIPLLLTGDSQTHLPAAAQPGEVILTVVPWQGGTPPASLPAVKNGPGPDQAAAGTGSISGQVTAADTGLALAGIEVVLTDSEGVLQGYYGGTDQTGAYLLENVPVGSYKVHFIPNSKYENNIVYAPEWFQAQAGFQNASLVAITANHTTPNINASLDVGGSISGRVTWTGNDARYMTSAIVYVYDSPTASLYDYLSIARVDPDGRYLVIGLQAGTYYVRFNNQNFVDDYYDHKNSLAESNPIPVSLGETTVNINGTLAVGGQIAGKVTNRGGSPVSGVGVYVYDSPTDAIYNPINSAVSTSTGGYSLGGLTTGSYYLRFFKSNYLDAYYEDQASLAEAEAVPVVYGSTTANINQTLSLGGRITGIVTDAANAVPLEDARVLVYNRRDATTYQYIRSVNTNAWGEYNVTGLPLGTYYLKFTKTEYVSTFYNGKTSLADADGVDAVPETVTGNINASLALGGKINGIVTAALGGTPLANVYVSIYSSRSTSSFVSNQFTDPSGAYEISGLPEGDYFLQFQSSGYITTYYDNHPTLAEADPVHVIMEGVTENIDASLDQNGIITGQVTDASTGSPLADVSLMAEGLIDDPLIASPIAFASTDDDGNYSFTNLTPGNYRIQYTKTGYLTAYYHDRSMWEDADPVTASINTITGSIDQALTLGGSISGRLTVTETGAPLGNAVVCAYTSQTDPYNYCMFYSITDTQGDYVLSGLPAGEYFLQFIAEGYLMEFYNDRSILKFADPLIVQLGQAISGIDASLSLGSRITGRVTSAENGAPLAGVHVYAGPSETIRDFVYPTNAVTGPDGRYQISGLIPGGYTLEFVPPADTDYLVQFYRNRASPDFADTVNIIGAHSLTTGIDAALQLGGNISGHVTAADTGFDLAEVQVSVYKATEVCGGLEWTLVGDAITDPSGAYIVHHLPPGDFLVQFFTGQPYNDSSAYLSEYYQGESDPALASLVHAASGQATTDIDAHLRLGGSITGRVSIPDGGDLVGDVRVTVVGSEGIKYAHTDLSGDYQVKGLETGSVKLYFESGSYGSLSAYAAEYYNDKSLYGLADPVNVTAGEETTGINTILNLGGTFTGVITAADFSNPLSWIAVTVYDAEGRKVSSTPTYSNGVYTTRALASGFYRIQFNTYESESVFTTEYYNDRSTLNTADPINLTAPEEKTIDAQLQIGGTITGTVNTAIVGTPLRNFAVTLLDEDRQEITSTHTDALGGYWFQGLYPGNYYVHFYQENTCPPFSRELFYNQQTTLDTADLVSVTGPDFVFNINAVFTLNYRFLPLISR